MLICGEQTLAGEEGPGLRQGCLPCSFSGLPASSLLPHAFRQPQKLQTRMLELGRPELEPWFCHGAAVT